MYASMNAFVRAWFLALALLCSGCSDVGYMLQSLRGHLALVQAARPVDQWLQDDSTPASLKEKLRLAQQIRQFGATQLHLPDNPSYTRYAELGRRAVVWNVVATPVDSLQAKTWCFAITGCISYRGYFDEGEAQALAQSLREQGLETSVYPVPAYSTLGWSNWLGGDPLLSTFIRYPAGELARMIFHELAHQVLYVPGDTTFNESFATAVERLGGAAWLANQGTPAMQQEYAALDQQRQAFRTLTRRTRARLQALFDTPGLQLAERLQRKQALYTQFRDEYAQERAPGPARSGYDAWVANANNASFASVAAYDQWVGGFEALFAQQQGDWAAFLAAARKLAVLPAPQRLEQLQLLQAHTDTSGPAPS